MVSKLLECYSNCFSAVSACGRADRAGPQTRGLEIDPYTQGPLKFDGSSSVIPRGETALSNKWRWNNSISTREKMSLDPGVVPHKNYSDAEHRPELKRYITGKHLGDLGLKFLESFQKW